MTSSVLDGAVFAAGFNASVLVGGGVGWRSILSFPNGQLLVVTRCTTTDAEIQPSKDIVALFDDDLDGSIDRRAVVVRVTTAQLTHSLAHHGEHLYASSDTTIYRWRYSPGGSVDVTSTEEVFVSNMNHDGSGGAPMGHWTRTIAIDARGEFMYISVGSAGNVDADSHRSRIRRIPFNDGSVAPPAGGHDFQAAEVFADGLRNEVGLAFDRHGVLWGVENGAVRRFCLCTVLYVPNPEADPA